MAVLERFWWKHSQKPLGVKRRKITYCPCTRLPQQQQTFRSSVESKVQQLSFKFHVRDHSLDSLLTVPDFFFGLQIWAIPIRIHQQHARQADPMLLLVNKSEKAQWNLKWCTYLLFVCIQNGLRYISRRNASFLWYKATNVAIVWQSLQNSMSAIDHGE